MYKLTDSEIRFLLNQDRLTKLEGIALLTGGYQEKFSTLDHISNGPSLSLKVLAFKDVLDLKTPPPNKPENLLIFNKIFEIDETISRSLGFTLFPVEDILDVYVIGAEDPTFETESFLEWAHQKGFIPPSLSQDLKPFLNTLTAAISTKPEKPGRERTSADSEALNMLPNQNALRNDSDTTISKKIEIDPPEIISSVLTKSWEPERPINRLSQNRELGIWNNWIQPIMNLHYNGVFGYKYFKEPENLNYDDLGALWEQYIAPVICSNIPPWLKYPQSMDQGELESLIGENIWEPEDFVSEIILPLKAGREPGLVDPFFRCLTSIIRRGDLPVLLAYIAQDRGCGATTLNVLSGVCTPGGDFPKDRMTQQDELAVWDRWIRPIIVKHFNGRIEYQFFNEPDVIAPDHINEVLREMLELFVYDYAHGPFPTDCFLKEVMDRLRAGFHKYEGVDLTELFNDFLSWTMDGGHLPAFLAYIDHERGGDVCETEQAETSHGASPVPIVPDKDLLNVMADNGTSLSNLPEKGFYTILEKYHADIGMFWESLSRKAKDRHGSIEVAQDFDLYDLAKEAYTDNSQHFVALKLADIDKREFYSRNAKPKRKIVGSILQKIVWREQPHMFGHPEIRNNTQWLFDQFNNHGL